MWRGHHTGTPHHRPPAGRYPLPPRRAVRAGGGADSGSRRRGGRGRAGRAGQVGRTEVGRVRERGSAREMVVQVEGRPPGAAKARGRGPAREHRLARLDVRYSPYLYVRRSSCSSRSSGSSRWSTRSGCRCTTGTCWRRTTTFVGAAELHPAAGRRRLLARAWCNTLGIFVHLHGAATAARAAGWPTCSTGGCGRGPLVRMARAGAERHLDGRGGDRLRAALRPRLRHDQLGARPGRHRRDRLEGRPLRRLDRPSPPWSTGGGPATTR